MKPFRLNLGKRFEKPYESVYTILRRFLVANPGIPLTTIEANLRRIAPEYGLVLSRICALQSTSAPHHEFYGNTNSYLRQCPECAKQLYHTDLFAMPWLTHCPIHHCELVTTCPGCGQPWPDKKALDKRACAYCGRLSFEQLDQAVMHDNDIARYRPVAEIYEFITCETRQDYYLHNKVLHDAHGTSEHWWRELSVDSPLFPSCQILRKPEFTKARLKALHIDFKPVRHRSTSLIPLDIKEEEACWIRKGLLAIEDIPQSHLESGFIVMQNILKWVWNDTQHNHRVHLSGYGPVHIRDFLVEPDPCPYCLALSLWFNDLAYQYFVYTFLYSDNHYRAYFCWEGGLNKFYEVCEPAISFNYSEKYKMNIRFSTWFYRRGLEISFLDILRFCFKLLERLKTYRQSSDRSYYYYSYLNREFPDQFCATEIIDDQFHFYYENEHPLDIYATPFIPRLEAKCLEYHRQHIKRYGNIIECHNIEPTESLTIDLFLSLLQKQRRKLSTKLF